MDNRGEGKKFSVMNNEFRKAKEKNRGYEDNGDREKNRKDKNKSHNKGNGRG
jgi:hypothetical protein